MNKTRAIQFRVTRDQYERIKNNAKAKGYLNLSYFLRDLALEKDITFERKFNEIYETIVGKGKEGKQRRTAS